MPQIIDSFLSSLVALLGPLSPFAKSVGTAFLGVAYGIVASIAEGKIDTLSLAPAIAALILAIVVYVIPNQPKPTPVPVTPPAGK